MRAFKLSFLYFIISFFVFVQVTFGGQKKGKSKELKSYSFRPLLIQGKKRLIQKTKDMKVETDNILETQMFFLELDFKKRIFSDEGLE